MQIINSFNKFFLKLDQTISEAVLGLHALNYSYEYKVDSNNLKRLCRNFFFLTKTWNHNSPGFYYQTDSNKQQHCL